MSSWWCTICTSPAAQQLVSCVCPCSQSTSSSIPQPTCVPSLTYPRYLTTLPTWHLPANIPGWHIATVYLSCLPTMPCANVMFGPVPYWKLVTTDIGPCRAMQISLQSTSSYSSQLYAYIGLFKHFELGYHDTCTVVMITQHISLTPVR